MKHQLSDTIYCLKFAMEKKDFERLKSSSHKKRNDFVANPIFTIVKLNRFHIFESLIHENGYVVGKNWL